MKIVIRILSLLLTGLLLFVGLVFLLVSIGQYDALQEVINQFAPDGTLESFTPVLHAQMRIPLLLFGGILFLLGGLSVASRSRYKKMMEETFQWIPSFLKAIWEDAKEFFKLLKPEKLIWWEWVLLALIILLAIAGRWTLIERPMGHDESYTFIAFASHSFRQVISDYHLPNNHIFNSVLIHFLYQLIGNPSPVVVRFPAFLAGAMVCISGYFFTRREYGKWQAVVVGISLAVLPVLKLQSVNGRGYMLMALFTLWMMALALIVRRSRNRFAWVLLIVISILNFWTLPVALYPFSIIAVWLLLSALIGDIADAYDGLANFLKYYIGFGVASGVITFLLYTPVFLIGSGWNSFFNNPFVESLTWNDFTQTLPIRLVDTWQSWTQDVPLAFTIFFILGGILYDLLRKQEVRHRISFPLVTLVVLTMIFIVQKPNPWARTWTYLLPLILIWCVSGWFALFKRLLKAKDLQKGLMVLGIVLFTGLSIYGGNHLYQNLQYFQGEKGQVETVTLWLNDEFNITEEDIVLTSIGYGPAYWYYFDRYEIPLSTVLRLKDRTSWDLIYLIVDDRENDKYLDLFSKQPIAPENCPEEVVELVHEYGHFTVYQCNAIKP